MSAGLLNTLRKARERASLSIEVPGSVIATNCRPALAPAQLLDLGEEIVEEAIGLDRRAGFARDDEQRILEVEASGGTNSSYTYTPANGDSVKCICTNSSPDDGVDTLTSNIIHMVVNPIVTDTLTITVFPGFKVCNGTAATFSVTGGLRPMSGW